MPDLSLAFAELDADRYRDGLDALIEAIRSAGGARDEIRRVVVGILDELGPDHPLATTMRSQLASALY